MKNSETAKINDEIHKEIKLLAERANQNQNYSLDFLDNQRLGDEDIDSKFDVSLLKDTSNPDKSYKLYYGMIRLLRDNLPKGDGGNKKLRTAIYDEKNLFLNRGIPKNINGIRGSDGRMTYINFMEVAFNLVSNWLLSGANPWDIYKEFWDLNEEKGFHAPLSDTTLI